MVWPAGYKLQGGQYTIEKELGEGGFGVAYLARNVKDERVVIKTLNDTVQQRPDFDKFQQDFLNEALRLAKCNHPHIVPIHQVLQEGRLWCMVMEYIEGEDLATHLQKQGVLPEAEALRYIQQIGEALTVIHNNNLLHRDVKPDNILVRAGTSEAILIDFGIAREFTPDVIQSHTQFAFPGFAPIEQYYRQGLRGPYSDVYALAATLYYVLTGMVPEEALERNKGATLVPPKLHNPKISEPVNRAILKGMELNAENRPQSVPQWLKELGWDSSSTATIFEASAPQWYRELELGNSTTIPLKSVSSTTIPLKPGSSTKTIRIPHQPHRPQWLGYILLGGVEAVTAMLSVLTRERAPSALIKTLTGHSSHVASVAFSPDGQTLASGGYIIDLWNVSTGQLKTTLTRHSRLVNSVAFSPDGQTLASGSYDKTIKLWNVSTRQLKTTLTGHSSEVLSVAFSPDGQTLASGSHASDSCESTIKLWNVSIGELKTTLIGHSEGFWSVAFSPDGQTLASGSYDKTIKLWNVSTGQLKTTLTGHSGNVNSVAFSPDGQTLASGSSDSTIKLWNVPTGQLKTTLTGHSISVLSVTFSPDGQTLASGSNDGTIKIWQVSP